MERYFEKIASVIIFATTITLLKSTIKLHHIKSFAVNWPSLSLFTTQDWNSTEDFIPINYAKHLHLCSIRNNNLLSFTKHCSNDNFYVMVIHCYKLTSCISLCCLRLNVHLSLFCLSYLTYNCILLAWTIFFTNFS